MIYSDNGTYDDGTNDDSNTNHHITHVMICITSIIRIIMFIITSSSINITTIIDYLKKAAGAASTSTQ